MFVYEVKYDIFSQVSCTLATESAWISDVYGMDIVLVRNAECDSRMSQ